MKKVSRISPEELAKLTCQERERLSALRLQLLESHPFWGYLLLQMQLVFQTDLPAFAATDCYRHIWFNPLMTSSLPIRQLGFVMLHEICHSVFASMQRRASRNHHLWNCATDYAINRIVNEIRQPGPRSGNTLYEVPRIVIEGKESKILLDAKYDGMIAEAIYEKLAADELENPTTLVLRLRMPGGCGEDPAEGPEGSSQQENSDGNHGNQDESEGDHTVEIPDVMDHGGGIDVHIPVPLSAGQREELADRIRAALETWQKMDQRGDVPLDDVRHLLPQRKARVPWERLLRQFAGHALAKDDYSLARPNKRYIGENIVVPGTYSESLNLVIIALDTSGSMSIELLSRAMAEIARLADLAPEVLLLVADADVHQTVPTVRLPAFLRELKVRGGGGTSHVPVFAYIDEKRLEPDLFIGITDLASNFPDQAPRYPVLWLTPPDPREPPWGRVIEIE